MIKQKVLFGWPLLVDFHFVDYLLTFTSNTFSLDSSKKLHPWKPVEMINFLHIRSKKTHPFVSAPMLWSESNPLADWAGWGCKTYSFSHNHGSVENGCSWKVTTFGGIHFWLSWLWKERHSLKLTASRTPPLKLEWLEDGNFLLTYPILRGWLAWHVSLPTQRLFHWFFVRWLMVKLINQETPKEQTAQNWQSINWQTKNHALGDLISQPTI